MNLQLLTRLTCMSASVAGLLLFTPHASAKSCEPEAAARWNPERSWPSSCELNVPLDGFVLLEGNALATDQAGGEGGLLVFVQRVSEGMVLERFDGSVSQLDGTSALFRSDRPLQANADYVLVAGRFSPEGELLGPSFTSAFSTGSDPLASVSFRQPALLELESSKKAVQLCALDECGSEQCESTGESRDVRIVRIEVPPIDGGIGQRPYAVTARLTIEDGLLQAPRVATSDTVVTQAGRRSFIVLEVPALASAAQGCVTIDAKDVAGHEATLEAGCIELPASAPSPVESLPSEAAPAAQDGAGVQGASNDAESGPSSSAAVGQSDGELEELAFESDLAAITEGEGDASIAEGAGCSVGDAPGSAGNVVWLTLALGWLGRRSRKR